MISDIWTTVRGILQGEGLRYDPKYLLPGQDPPPLESKDLYLLVHVTEYDEGNLVLRYLAGPLARLVGLGAVRLTVEGKLRHGDGTDEDYRIRAAASGGIAGGSSYVLMKINAQRVSVRLARSVTRHLLNRTVTNYWGRLFLRRGRAYGLLGLIPVFGSVFLIPGVVYAFLGTALILKRRLPHKARALAAIGANLAGAAIQFFILSSMFPRLFPRLG